MLENLIRNALQHSSGNTIGIIQKQCTIRIFNKAFQENGLDENTGFGLGLEIIKRLTDNLGWKLKILKNNEYNVAIIRFANTPLDGMTS